MKARTYHKLAAKNLQQNALSTTKTYSLSTTTAGSTNPVTTTSLAPITYSKNNPAGQTIAAILTDLPGLLAVAVVDATSGMALASHTNSPSINPETAAAYNTEVVKQKQKAMSALKLTGEHIEDILITLTNQLHLLKLNTAGNKFTYLVVNARETNLAIAREVLRAHADQMN